MRTRNMIWGLGAGMACLLASGAPSRADVIYLQNDRALQAQDIQWRESEKIYRVTTLEGVVTSISKDQVLRVEIAKPPKFDQAVALANAGKYAEAIPILEEIATQYRMRFWDMEARRVLAQGYMATKEPKKAADAMESVMASMPKTSITPEAMKLYWEALQGAGRGAALKKDLDEVVASGARDMAAVALIARANINRAEGKKEQAVEDYLRVVILFQNVKSVQPEALFKAAEILDELRDARADDLKKRLMQEYKDSEYAAKVSGKI